MTTSVHLPKPLLDALNRRARALNVSRNSLIVRAVERELEGCSEWSPGFFDRLANVEPEVAEAADELLVAVLASRRSKAAPTL